jgi:hypothetical protein
MIDIDFDLLASKIRASFRRILPIVATRFPVLLARVTLFAAAIFIGLVTSQDAYAADFDAAAIDIWLEPSTPEYGDTADIRAQFKNLSSSSGPYGGEATFDAAIVVVRPNGADDRYSIDVLATSTNGTVWDPRDQGWGRAWVNSLRISSVVFTSTAVPLLISDWDTSAPFWK